jgi:hypothetical protein
MNRKVETYKVDLLLDSKYDIELQQYWKLSDEDKNELAKLVVQQIHKGFRNLNDLPYHISQLDDRRMESEEDEQFERADIIRRIMEKTIEFYN